MNETDHVPHHEPALAPKAISLFAGAGGCSLGFKQAGYQVLFATDIDPDAVATYQQNFPKTPCEQADVRDLTASSLLEKAGLGEGELDVLLGGPPCQGFSSAGGKLGSDPRNSLVTNYVRLLHELRPKWFVMENVEGLLTSGGGLLRSHLDRLHEVRLIASWGAKD